MKVVDNLTMRAAPWAISTLTIGVLVFDLLTPVGVAGSILYILPLMVTVFSPRKSDPSTPPHRDSDHWTRVSCGVSR
jgi:hypothetical protein